MDHISVMFALFRAQVCGADQEEQLKSPLSAQTLESLFALSKQHDLAHIVGYGLQKRGLLAEEELAKKFQYQVKLAIYRSALLQQTYTQVCGALEEAAIAFIPLKGAVIRQYYPEPWMRTSSDIDILIPEQHLAEAVNRLVALGYEYRGKHACDVSLFSPVGMHVELHFDLIADFEAGMHRQILADVWEQAEAAAGSTCRYELPDALFYYYHMAHMAKHVRNGGCGIRPLLDTWLLNHRVEHDAGARRALLARGGLQTFAQQMEKLAQVWFSGEQDDPVTVQLAEFVLDNGVYGTYGQKLAMRQTGSAGKTGYFFSRVFLPYERMKHLYPVLKKHKWMLPFCEVARWTELLFNGGTKRAAKAIKTGNELSEQQRLTTAQLLSILGLEEG